MTIKSIDDKFKSGNGVAVTLASVTSDEWEAVKARIAELEEAIRFACAPDMWLETGNGLLEYRYIDWYVDVLQEALRGGE